MSASQDSNYSASSGGPTENSQCPPRATPLVYDDLYTDDFPMMGETPRDGHVGCMAGVEDDVQRMLDHADPPPVPQLGVHAYLGGYDEPGADPEPGWSNGEWRVGEIGVNLVMHGVSVNGEGEGVSFAKAVAAGVVNMESETPLPVSEVDHSDADASVKLLETLADVDAARRDGGRICDAAPGEPVRKRYRLSGKTTATSAPSTLPAPVGSGQSVPQRSHCRQQSAAKDSLAAGAHVKGRATDRCNELAYGLLRVYATECKACGSSYNERRWRLKTEIAKLSAEVRARLTQWAIEEPKAVTCPYTFASLFPSLTTAAADGPAPKASQRDGQQTEIIQKNDRLTPRCKTVMLTYHGSWGAHDPKVAQLMTNTGPLGSLKRLILGTPFYAALWRDFKAFARKLSASMQWPLMSMLMEVTIQRKKPENLVHFHLVMSDPNYMHRRRCPADFAWNESTPHVSFGCPRKGTGFERMSNELHYYCQAPKMGALRCASNHKVVQQFQLQGKFVYNLFAKFKIDADAAKQDLIYRRCADAESQCKRIDYVKSGLQAMKVEKAQCAAYVVTQLRPAVIYPEIVAWMEQYRREWYAQSRFTFLVLVGDSQFGKTTFARKLYGQHRTLVCQCQSAIEPPLRTFDRSLHRCIVFDEASAKWVVSHKSVFQAGLDACLLGQSKTNSLTYSVWLHGVPLIVCTNSWMNDVDTQADRDWLDSNSTVVEVKKKMWLPEDSKALPPPPAVPMD